MSQPLTLTLAGVVALNLTDYLSLTFDDSDGTLARPVCFPPYSTDSKLVVSSTYAFPTSEGNVPFGVTEVGYFDLGSDSPSTLQTLSIGLEGLPTPPGPFTFTSEHGALVQLGVVGDIFFTPQIPEDYSGTGRYPPNGFAMEGDAGSFGAAAYQSISGAALIGAPAGSAFSIEGALYFSVDPNGLEVKTGQDYATLTLLSGLNMLAEGTGDYGGNGQIISYLDTGTGITYSALQFFNGQTGTYVELTENGTSFAVYEIFLPDGTQPPVSGAVSPGGFYFMNDGVLNVFKVESNGTGTLTAYTIAPQDTVAQACYDHQDTTSGFGGITQLSNGNFIFTNANTRFDSSASAYFSPILTAISSPGTDTVTPSMDLTLTSIGGTYGVPLALGGTYDYADTPAPTALDIGIIQGDGTTVWSAAGSSIIGISTPTGGFTTQGGIIT